MHVMCTEREWCGVVCGMDRSKPSSITVPNETGYGDLLSIRYIVHVRKRAAKRQETLILMLRLYFRKFFFFFEEKKDEK